MVPSLETGIGSIAGGVHLHNLNALDWQTRSAGRVSGLMGYVGRAVAEAVFPQKCRACGSFWSYVPKFPSGEDRHPVVLDPVDGLADVFQAVAMPWLCPDCITSFEAVASPLCGRCGVMFQSRVGEDHLCSDCMRRPGNFRRARAAGVYSGAIMALIHQLKYRACLALIHPLGRLLQEAFRRHWQPEEVDMVLSIPLHNRRLRQRGFNQAQMLVDAWANAVREEKRDWQRFPKAREIIVRSRPTAPQAGLGKPERRRNIRRAFKVVDRSAVQGRRILLVDDVYTTGATAEEAAHELKKNGADSVDVLTVARTMPHSGS